MASTSTGGKRKTYNAKFKLSVVQVAEDKGKRHAAKLFNVHRRRVQEWCQQKELLEKAPKSQVNKKGAGRPLKYPDIERELVDWFEKRRQARVRVTGKALKREALRLHEENGNQSFKGSAGWFRRFCKRHNIAFRRSTHIAQHAKELTDDRVDKFLRFVISMRRLRGYRDQDILNMDETPVWFEMPGKSTYDYKGKSEITVSSTGHEKQRITVTLAAYADGTKLAPLVHLPGLRPPAKLDVPSGIVIYMCGAGQKSWANEESIKFWLQKLYGVNNQNRRMLVWDAFRAHITAPVKALVKTTYNSDMCCIPGGCTSKLQPADVSWNRPFKMKVAELYD